MRDKLPDGVVLEIKKQSGVSRMCDPDCYFLSDSETCPTEWKNGVFVRSCTNNRNICFKEIGESDGC